MRRIGWLLIVLLGGTAGAEDRAPVSIEAQPMSQALSKLAEKSGLQLAYLPHITDGLLSPGTQGAVAPIQALQQLLEGSGLEYELINATTVVIRRSPAEVSPESENDGRSPDPPATGSLPPTEREPPARGEQILDEVVVTGSRIGRSGQLAPTPSTIISGDSLREAGFTRVADFLVELPAIGATHTVANSNDDPAESGAGLLDLRRLGIERTLVLVNGRRQIGSRPGTSAIDVNTVPVSLVERIEIITGAASAVYGADAVSGVVNIILKRDIDGVAMRLQTGRSSRDDGETLAVSITAGAALGDERGRVYLDLSYSDAGGIDALDRSYASGALRFAPDTDGGADFSLLAGTRFNNTPASGLPVLDSNGTPLPGGPFTFDAAGRLTAYDPGAVVAGEPSLSVGGDGIFLAPFDRLQVPLELQIISAGMQYSLHRDLSLFADGKHARALSSTAGQPSFSLTTFVPLTISADNAFIQPDLAAVLAGDPGDSTDDIPEFFLSRTHVDLGRRLAYSERDTTQLLLGLHGKAGERWDYELAWQYGRTTNVTELRNNQVDARLQQAVDAVFDSNGNISCRDPANGCVPVNLLGQGLVSDAGRRFVLADVVTRGVLEQSIYSAVVTGRPLALPAGPVGIAAGIEYREESSRTEEGELRNEGRLFPGGPIEDVTGHFEVAEAFGEVVIPLIAGRRLVHASSFEAALRVADYSTIGATTTWRFGGDWLPVDGLRFRGVLAHAVRAPNIGELFAPARLQNLFLSDPCDQANLAVGSTNRPQNCAALGLPPDFQSSAGSITTRVFSGGNADLNEEDARTLTFGVVVAPPESQFALTLDWWSIEISDAVNAFPVQASLNNCVDLPTKENPFCASITRDTSGQLQAVESSLINVAAQRARGVDAELNYSLPAARLLGRGTGMLHLNALATYLDRLDFRPLANQPDLDREAGELGDPRFAANLRLSWQSKNLALSIQERMLTSQVFDRNEGPGVRRPRDTGFQAYTDLSLRYRWQDRYALFAGINNVFDRAPPIIARVPEVRSFGDDVALFDAVGRYFFAGVTATLP